MKRICFLFMLVLCVIVVRAQDKVNKHQFSVEAGVGGNGVASMDLGLRYQINFHPNIAWDVLTVKGISSFDNFPTDDLLVEAMSGLRLTSPSLNGLKAYATGKVGYGNYCTSTDESGFVFEGGGGLYLTKHFYVGYAFNQISYDTDVRVGKKNETVSVKGKYHACRIGFTF